MVEEVTNKKERKTRGQRILEQQKKLREKLWPNTPEEDVWNRTRNDGFASIPRTMPLIHLIMDDLSNGAPLSTTYFSLWSRNWDEGVIVIENPRELAFEAGFSGQRAETTWNGRMKKLAELKFIKTQPGTSGEYHNVLIRNPHIVINELEKAGKVNASLYNTLFARAQKVGADDLK